MKKTNRILSLVLCAVMVLTLIPEIGFTEAEASLYVVSTAEQLKTALEAEGTATIRIAKDIDEKLDKDKYKTNASWRYTEMWSYENIKSIATWAVAKGNKTLHLDGHKVKLTLEKTPGAEMIRVGMDSTLSIYDNSEKKTGELAFDADIDSDNTARLRIVLRNWGTLNIYGGVFTPGHYNSYYSYYACKRVYRMTTGLALWNCANCTVYGGQFTGRNHDGSCIENKRNLVIYDAYLYAKGSACCLRTPESGSTEKIYAVEADCFKEDLVRNSVPDESLSYDEKDYIGRTGITEDMLMPGSTVKEKTDSKVYKVFEAATKLVVYPGFTGSAAFYDGTTECKLPVADDGTCDGSVIFEQCLNSKPYFSKTGYNYYINWRFKTEYQEKGSKDWKKEEEGYVNTYGYELEINRIKPSFQTDRTYRITLTPVLVYDGWSHLYKVEGKSSVTVLPVVGSTVVTFDACGGTVSPSKRRLIYPGIYGTLPVPEKKGFEFIGWFTEKEGGIRVLWSALLRQKEDHTLYAHWKNVSPPKFTSDLPITVSYFKNSDNLHLKVAAEGGNVTYSWQISSDGFNWRDLTAEEMGLEYEDETGLTYTYYNEITGFEKFRCCAKNEYGVKYSGTANVTHFTPQKSSDCDLAGQFLFYVGDVFNVSGNAVVTGKVVSGQINKGDFVTVIDGSNRIEATVAGITKNRVQYDSCTVGEEAGLMLKRADTSQPEITTDMLAKGQAIVQKGSSLRANTKVSGTLTKLTRSQGGNNKPWYTGNKTNAFIGVKDTASTFTTLSGMAILAGEMQTGVTLTLDKPAVMYYGQVLALREAGRTFGYLTVTNVSNGDNGYVRVNYEYNDGGPDPYKDDWENYPESVFMKSGEDYGTLPAPFKDGYAFTKWTSDEKGAYTVTAASKIPSKEVTLYAQYEKIQTLTVTLDGNGADKLTVKALSLKPGEPYEGLPVPERNGYDFVGWHTADGDRVSNGEYPAYSVSHTLTASWVKPGEDKDTDGKPVILSEIVKGDVDDSGEVEVTDARYALRAAIKLTDEGLDFSKKTNREFIAADVDGNGRIEVTDARTILRVAIKLEKL